MEERDIIAERILIALLQNPERYKYISQLVDSGKISQEVANQKNITKAFKIADSFIKYRDNQRD